MKYWIERFTNRVTMEKLILYCLFAVFAFALLLSVFGQLAFSPLALIVSFAVLIFASYGLNLLFGYLFGVGVSYESPVITALILGLIVPPALTPAGLGMLVLIALVAMASKFVLVVRGRHLFNPAAIAVLLVGFTGLQYATWWVATPALLPIVALGAFVIAFKTRHLLMVSLFLLTSGTLIIGSSLLVGAMFGTAFAYALFSWPIVFFGGYMLTEPLTLPPRRWQKILLAVLAGIGVALPFSVAGISSSPELVLVLMNIVAFLWGQRRGIRLELKEVRLVTPTVKEFLFSVPSPVRFLPGQYMEIHLPQKKPDSRGTRRSFSIIGVPGEQTISLSVKMPEKPSSFKRALNELAVGTKLKATRVSGDFVLPKDSNKSLLYIAGGIGITPFVSHVRALQKDSDTRDITLLYAVANTEEAAYIDVFLAAGVKVVVVTSDIRSRIEGVAYINAPYITQEVLSNSVVDARSRRAYVSGPPLMVTAVDPLLKNAGVREIQKDYFIGY